MSKKNASNVQDFNPSLSHVDTSPAMSDGAHLEQTLKDNASSPFIAKEVIRLIVLDKQGMTDNIRLGMFYNWFESSERTQAERTAALEALIAEQKAYGIDVTLPSDTLDTRDRLAAVLYADKPELLVKGTGTSTTTKASKRISRARADYREYINEQDAILKASKAQEIAETFPGLLPPKAKAEKATPEFIGGMKLETAIYMVSSGDKETDFTFRAEFIRRFVACKGNITRLNESIQKAISSNNAAIGSSFTDETTENK